MSDYYAPTGGLPPQTAMLTGRAVFTEAYAVIPRGCFSDIVTSLLPGWRETRLWMIARPMSGFAETFSQYVMEVAPGGGSDAPCAEAGAEHILFVTEGLITLTIDGIGYELDAGGYAFIPPELRENGGELEAARDAGRDVQLLERRGAGRDQLALGVQLRPVGRGYRSQ